ncbi:prefoldin subunit 6 [Schizosaccharomyces octosporus yFS286]|uniref:Prefoldin subunit 6 n=1 Tax=Schizosaccharomyces octosporus (strain yFS286) TaxID=483514 RepID=S9PZ30_SCHOY|nr:prefoldin subunit 6 [Schizosaccharomyces octosporus yFS286]EPX72703.1 prefoldin subunit 6 [Schizosaccharomyces octosporus yFS286]
MEDLARNYQEKQSELTGFVDSIKKLEAQLQENTTVYNELERIDGDSNIYKQIGPTLVKQTQEEAKTNVQTRLDFIKKEIARVENQIEGSKVEFAKLKSAIVQAQTEAASKANASS